MFLLLFQFLFILAVLLLITALANLAFKGSNSLPPALATQPEYAFKFKKVFKKNGGLIQYWYTWTRRQTKKAVPVVRAFADSLFPAIPGKEVLFSAIVPVALVGALLYAVSRRGRAIQNISCEVGPPTGIKFDVETYSVYGKINLTFDNASPQAVTFQNLYLKITKGAAGVGNVANNVGGTIAGASRTVVPCDLRVNALQLGPALQEAIQSGKIDGLQIDGFVTAGSLNIYIRKPLTVSLPALPEWFKQIKQLFL